MKKITGLIISIPVYVRATVITGILYLNKTCLTGTSVDMTIGLTAWPVDRLTGKQLGELIGCVLGRIFCSFVNMLSFVAPLLKQMVDIKC